MPHSLLPSDITGCVLAGGRGARMGGVDKGLEPFLGQPLALHALQRLAPQVGQMLINANRNEEAYATLGQPFAASVCPDAEPDYPGPLAGFLSGLSQCHTAWLVCVPCDTPLFPQDLAQRMAAQAADGEIDIVVAHGWETSADGCAQLRAQPVFCLMKASLKDSLQTFVRNGGRKIDAWTTQHRCSAAVFDTASDLHAFANANTATQLHDLEQQAITLGERCVPPVRD